MIGKVLVVELGGGTIIAANRSLASGWETFRVISLNALVIVEDQWTSFRMQVFNKQFLGLDSTGIKLVATATDYKTSGAKTQDLVTVASKGDGQWRDDDPSVFEMTIAQRMQGEYQVTHGYGPSKAPQIMNGSFLQVLFLCFLFLFSFY
ncbi:putative fascin [Helianthus anomalus]